MDENTKKRLRLGIAALVMAPFAMARAAEFDASVDSLRGPESEDSALFGFIVLKDGAAGAHAVGSVARAYSVSAGTGNTVWGVVSEAVNFPAAQGNVVGIESGVVNMNPSNDSQLRGLHLVFKDRTDLAIDAAVPVVGRNHYNENSAALYIASQPRSGAGEYSGWQSGIKFDAASLDRSASVPYAAAIDVSEAQVPATFYLIVWRCGDAKCGLKPTDDGAIIVRDVDRAQ
ncbi:MAG TPA: hypothetical protein VLY46_05170 [Usitatibacter sp.]|nr:hypothetical protein [Usitatibacter sp.]